ncbi:hypothetical protein B0H13DRAFT_2351607 [Mycena leptocephala]|nr:hypothetical protein B0H13DRAFT_2351607 [Mycena leptocephala]
MLADFVSDALHQLLVCWSIHSTGALLVGEGACLTGGALLPPGMFSPPSLVLAVGVFDPHRRAVITAQQHDILLVTMPRRKPLEQRLPNSIAQAPPLGNTSSTPHLVTP